MSWVAKLKLARPKEIPSSITGDKPLDPNSDNPHWVIGNKFIKQHSKPTTAAAEALTSRAHLATQTPGAIETKAVYWPETGKWFTVSPFIKAPELGDSGINSSHIQPASDILLSELLTHTQDRHNGNYLVNGQHVHSIDHEMSLKPTQSPTFYSRLYSAVHNLGIEPVASREHLSRWLQYAPEYVKLLKDKYPDHTKSFIQLLLKAHALSKHTGSVPLKQLIPESWRKQIYK